MSDTTEEIKARLDIVEVVSEHVALKRSGSNYKGLCPFHSEKTPSFMVSPSKQIFHCFGCGAGGDVFGFIMQYERVAFPEALEMLARRAGVEVRPRARTSGDSESEALLRLHSDAADYFAGELQRSDEARAYLKKRGLDEATVAAFRLGWAPSRPDSLYKHLTSKGYADALMVTAGVVRFDDRGRPYDMFRHRLIFPIADAAGRVIAFGARVVAADAKGPKYLNSPETPIFKKGITLYGLHAAKDPVRRKGYAIIAEGYIDVIALHQFGFTHAVAPLGTALTEGHLKKLRNLAGKLLLVFDGDDAGLQAARRSLPTIYQNGLRGKVLLLPSGYDPDTYLREKGAKEFQKLFPQAREVVDFYLGLKEDRVEVIRELIGLVAQVRDAILRGQLVTETAQKTSIPGAYLVEEVQKLIKHEKVQDARQPVRSARSPEETLLAVAFLSPAHAREVIGRLHEEDFEQPVAREVFQKVRAAGTAPQLDRLSAAFGPEEASYITALTIAEGFDEDRLGQVIEDCLRRLRTRLLRRRIDDMELRIKIAESAGDFPALGALLSKKQTIIQEARNEGIL